MACTDLPRRLLAAAALALGLVQPLAAHEFWIAPEDYTLETGQDLVADLRVGQKLDGSTFPYLPPRFLRFDLLAPGGEVFELPGRIGDNPALNVSGLPDGLLELVYVSTPSVVTYDDAATYAIFIEEEDFGWVVERNAERGLDPVELTEKFSRYAKSLVAVGDGRGQDRRAGLKIEIVAGRNPYTDDLSEGMPLSVHLDGAPYADARVRVLQRAPDGSVTVTPYDTGPEGRVTVDVIPGAMVLANVVAMEELDGGDAQWHSHWASLTFRAPE